VKGIEKFPRISAQKKRRFSQRRLKQGVKNFKNPIDRKHAGKNFSRIFPKISFLFSG
jgi:hypothetical protein